MRKIGLSFVLIIAVSFSTTAFAQAVIASPSGSIIIGVNPLGELNAPGGTNGYRTQNGSGGNVGIAFNYTGTAHPAGYYDATSPGCLCEGWGASVGSIGGYTNQDKGHFNINPVSFTSNATNIVSTTNLNGTTLQVTQDYHSSAGTPNSLFEDTVTLMNTGSSTLTGVKYDRVMDWDVPFTEFDEFVTLQGWPATALYKTNDNGFETGNPLAIGGSYDPACPANANFSHCGPYDHGAQFVFNFGDLAAGESRTFSIFYGYAPDEAAALAALGAVSAEVYSLGQQNIGGRAGTDSNTFMFAFKGVGGTPITDVPEPASMLLLGSGLALLARKIRK